MVGIGMGFGLLFLVFIFGGVILLALLLVKALFPDRPRRSGLPADRELTPQETLDRRYARGEITHDQYEQIKLDLAS